MQRSALRDYLISLVAAALPLAACDDSATPRDAGVGCGTYVAAATAVDPDAGCYGLCAAHQCPTGFCGLSPQDAGDYLLTCSQDHTGRRPPGLIRPAPTGETLAARYLASAAHLEAASVPAFERLAEELRRARAPRHLIAGAERSAREERRHARVMGRMARRAGAIPPAPRLRRTRPRSLAAIATDNAVEGCVKETYGALVALYQSRAARDPVLRTTMVRIADDEIRHAELAWEIDRWIRTRLTSAARTQVERRRRAAIAAMRRKVAQTLPAPWRIWLGIPSGSQAQALLAGLSETVWRERLA